LTRIKSETRVRPVNRTPVSLREFVRANRALLDVRGKL
jgi:hypothetical protein